MKLFDDKDKPESLREHVYISDDDFIEMTDEWYDTMDDLMESIEFKTLKIEQPNKLL